MQAMTPEEMMLLPSERLMVTLNECRVLMSNMADELADAICNYKTLERMYKHQFAVIKRKYLVEKHPYNTALTLAEADPENLALLNNLQAAYDVKKPLEVKYEIYNNNLKGITALTYLKNTELKNGV